MRRKLLIIQERVPHYRIPLFVRLKEFYDITVVHNDHNFGSSDSVIPNEFLPVRRFVGLANMHGLQPIIDNADLCIVMFNLRWTFVYQLILNGSARKSFLWGIGMSSSKGLKRKVLLDKLRNYIVTRYRGLLLYSNIPENIYSRQLHKVFVVGNTIEVKQERLDLSKICNDILFIGSLNERKGLREMIGIYAELRKNTNIGHFHIVGRGDIMSDLQKLVEELDISGPVEFHDHITETKTLQEIANKSIASVSLFQAGLGIVHSLALGVPFLSMNHAITGGELQHIIPGRTGFLCRTMDDVYSRLRELLEDTEKQIYLKKFSYNYYQEHLDMANFAKNFVKILG